MITLLTTQTSQSRFALTTPAAALVNIHADVAGQLVYLGWNLELATLVMASTHHLPDPSQAAAPQADKYVIFMHLGDLANQQSPTRY